MDNALQFAENYFNFEYAKAIEYCTPESVSWIKFSASNLNQNDIKIINSNKNKATCTIKNVAYENDTTAIVTINVDNFYCTDSIGACGKFIPSAKIRLISKQQNGDWKISLTEVPTEEQYN